MSRPQPKPTASHLAVPQSSHLKEKKEDPSGDAEDRKDEKEALPGVVPVSSLHAIKDQEQTRIYVLRVHLIRARKLPDCDWFGGADPYVTVSVGDNNWTSSVIEGDQDPVWDERTTFALLKEPSEILFTVMDQNKRVHDTFIGMAKVGMEQCFQELLRQAKDPNLTAEEKMHLCKEVGMKLWIIKAEQKKKAQKRGFLEARVHLQVMFPLLANEILLSHRETGQDLKEELVTLRAENRELNLKLAAATDKLQRSEEGNLVIQRDLARRELKGRVEDLATLEAICGRQLEVGATKEVKQALVELVTGIEERHKEIEAVVASHLTQKDLTETVTIKPRSKKQGAVLATRSGGDEKEEKGEVVSLFEAVKRNNQEWRDLFLALVRARTKLDPAQFIGQDGDEDWWPHRAAGRKDLYDEAKASPEEEKLLMDAAQYVTRRFQEPRGPCDEPVNELYVPFKHNADDELDKHHIVGTLHDGLVLGLLLDKSNPGFLDARVFHQPADLDPSKAQPLDDEFVEDNQQLVLSSAKALGLPLPGYEAKDVNDPEKVVPLMIALVNATADKNLDRYFDPNERPEYIRLLQEDELPEDLQGLSGADFLDRLVNQKLGRPLDTPIEDYNTDMYKVCATLSPLFDASAPCTDFGENPKSAAVYMNNFVRQNLGVDTPVTAGDLLSGNRNLQRLFAAAVLSKNDGLEPLSDEERAKLAGIEIDDAIRTKEESLVNFLNGLLGGKMVIRNLHRDLADGVVLCHIMEAVKKGSVDWKKVREKAEIRHKFDKVNNCNEAFQAATKGIGLNLVNTSGEDFHNGNQKLIHSMLWQLMRYKAVETIQTLGEDKDVTDSDIRAWANDSVMHLDKRRSRLIKSFRDPQLTTCVFYAEILKVMLPNAPMLLSWEVSPLEDPRHPDGEALMKQRLANARFVMTMARREGAELFILPEDLVGLDKMAVTNMLASLMIIDLQKQKVPTIEGQKTQPKDENLFYDLDAITSEG